MRVFCRLEAFRKGSGTVVAGFTGIHGGAACKLYLEKYAILKYILDFISTDRLHINQTDGQPQFSVLGLYGQLCTISSRLEAYANCSLHGRGKTNSTCADKCQSNWLLGSSLEVLRV